MIESFRCPNPKRSIKSSRISVFTRELSFLSPTLFTRRQRHSLQSSSLSISYWKSYERCFLDQAGHDQCSFCTIPVFPETWSGPLDSGPVCHRLAEDNSRSCSCFEVGARMAYGNCTVSSRLRKNELLCFIYAGSQTLCVASLVL